MRGGRRGVRGGGGRSPGRAGGTALPRPRPLSAGVGGAVSRGTHHPLPAICGRRPPACFAPPFPKAAQGGRVGRRPPRGSYGHVVLPRRVFGRSPTKVPCPPPLSCGGGTAAREPPPFPRPLSAAVGGGDRGSRPSVSGEAVVSGFSHAFGRQPDRGAVSPAAILRRRHRCEGAAPLSPAAICGRVGRRPRFAGRFGRMIIPAMAIGRGIVRRTGVRVGRMFVLYGRLRHLRPCLRPVRCRFRRFRESQTSFRHAVCLFAPLSEVFGSLGPLTGFRPAFFERESLSDPAPVPASFLAAFFDIMPLPAVCPDASHWSNG